MKRTYGYWGEPSEEPPPPSPRSFPHGGNSAGGAVFAPAPPPLQQQQQQQQQQPYYDDYFDDGDGEDDLRLGADAGLDAFDVGEGDGGGGFGGGDSGWGGGGGGFQQAPPPPAHHHHPPPPPQPQRRGPPAAWAVQAVRDAAAAAAGVPVTGGPALSSFAAGGAWPPPPARAAAAPPPPPPQPQQHHHHHQNQQQPRNPPPPARRPTRFLAVCYGGGGGGSHNNNHNAATAGLAFFDGAARELSLLQRPDERRGPAAFEVLTEAVLQLRPHVLCLSAKAGADVVAACRRALAQATRARAARPATADEQDDEEDAPADPRRGDVQEEEDANTAAAPTLVYERAALFGYDQALVALSSALRQQQQQRPSAASSGGNGSGSVSGLPDLSPAAALQVCAGGALVALLRRERVLAPDEDDADDDNQSNAGNANANAPSPPPLLRCRPLPLPACVDVAPDALRLLGVFRSASHPSRMGIGSTRREGRGSLFALLSSRCKTQSGRRMLRRWLSRPLADLPSIAARHDAVAALLKAPRETWRALERALAPAQDLAALVARLRLAQGRPDPAAYRQLLAALAALRELRDAAAVLLLGDGVEAEQGDAAGAASSSVAGGGGGRQAAAARSPPPLARLPAASRLHAAVDDAAFAECARLVEETLEVGAAASGPAAAAAGGGAGSAAAAALVDGGTLVRAGVCPQLDRLRAAYHALPDALTAAVDAELARVPPSAAMAHAAVVAPPQPSASAASAAPSHPAPPPVSRIRFSILYLPQVGFVLAVGGGRLGPSMLAALPDYEFAFSNSETGPAFTAYYCCDATRALNRRWGDLMWRIQDLEAAISAALVRRVLDGNGGGGGGGGGFGSAGGGGGVGAALLAAAPAVAELDCVSALAAGARDHGWVRPQVTTGTRLVVKGGRDPLVEARRLRLEGSAAGVVPNDACIGSDDDEGEEGQQEEGARGGNGNGSRSRSSPRALVVMGPNASGKSVFARQAVLAALLAHVGSFVPCQSATVGLADRLIVVAAGAGGGGGGGVAGGGGDNNAAPTTLAGRRPSSFQADLLRMGAAMRSATRRSIVLLDEFGSGTLSCDGAGLLAAVLEAWAGGGGGGGAGAGVGTAQGSPRVLACTHFTELLDPRVLDPRRAPRLRFLSMGVVVRGGEGEGGGGGGRGGGGLGARRRPQPVFLYRAEPNPTRAAPAFGVECARLAGVPPCVTSRAAVVLAAMTGSVVPAAAAEGEDEGGGGGATTTGAAAAAPQQLPRLLPRGVAPLPMPGAAEDDALAERLAEGLGRVRLEGEGEEGDWAAGDGTPTAPTLRSLLQDALGYELGGGVAAELAAMAT